MKYIYYIIVISIIVSVGIFYSTYEKSLDKQEYAIIINDKVISPDVFQKKYKRQREYQDRSELINSIIMKELLIQEAKRSGIDREESFRRSIQNYYEQSLTKILLDRKYNQLTVEVSQNEIDRYLDLCGRNIKITLFSTTSTSEGTNMSDVYQNFSNDLRMSLLSISIGEKTKVIMNYGDEVAVRLDFVGEKSKSIDPVIPADEARTLIREYKRQLEVQLWMDDLRGKAAITINQNETL